MNRNQVTGALGSCIDRTLIKQNLRKCTIIGERALGEKSKNGTYTGILGLLQSNQVDLFLKGESEFIDEVWLKKTLPMRTEK